MVHNPTQLCVICGVAPTRGPRFIHCDACNAEGARAKIEHKLARPARACLDCATTVTGSMRYCPPHSAARAKVRALKGAAAWRERNREKARANTAAWYRENVARVAAVAKERAKLPRVRAAACEAVRRWRATPAGQLWTKNYVRPGGRARVFAPPLMTYPFIRIPRDEHAELIEVNGLVPRGLPGRADVVQEIMLALYERRETIDAVRAGSWRRHVRSFYKANHEAAGMAFSIDEPRIGGGSWHDVLRAEQGFGR